MLHYILIKNKVKSYQFLIKSSLKVYFFFRTKLFEDQLYFRFSSFFCRMEQAMGQPESLEVPSWKLTMYAKKIPGPTFVRPVTMWVPFQPTKLSSKSYVSFSHICFIMHYVAKFLVNFHTFFTYDTQTNFISTLSTRKNPYLLDNAGAPF